MRAPLKSLLSAVLALVLLGAVAPVAHAQYSRSFLIKRPGLYSGKLGPGAARRCKGDLTAAAPNKGWDPRVDAITNVTVVRSAMPGCTGSGSATFAGDSFFVTWSGECVQPGDFVILTVSSTTPLTGNGVVWQDNFFTTVATGTIDAITFPALDPRGMVLMVVGLGGLGLWALRRRNARSSTI